jgi:hypothetical protein
MLRGHRRVRLSEQQRLVGGNLGACNLDGLRAEPVAVVERHEAARTEQTSNRPSRERNARSSSFTTMLNLNNTTQTSLFS